ncbi:MAG TPA: NTP transferase domain-containing protein [Gemmatimonadaceae bacterium]|nr:NTP transferase domain-containing protein [Gemmatimonadaceae bacterium]
MTTLLCLAAGASSRFGRPKQLEPVLADGATILDFTIADAERAGVGGVVVVIREEQRARFESGLRARWAPRLSIELVAQAPRAPGGAPWGTVDAVLAAAPLLRSAFVVTNADDFYGRASLTAVIRAMAPLHLETPQCVVAGFRLGDTLSEAGGVHRAALRVRADTLAGIEELRDLVATPDGGVIAENAPARRLSPDTLVSMNLWGLTPAVLPAMSAALDEFRRTAAPHAELRIADVVASLLAHSALVPRVIAVRGPWAGLTHPADRAGTSALLRSLTERGDYSSPPWS